MKPTRDQAVQAVKTLLAYAGEDPDRPGLVETPDRVVSAYEEAWFAGYVQKPEEVLKAFEDGAEGYDGILYQGNIPVESLCEHHLATFVGVAHFGYIPNGKVVGLSKIARLIRVFSQRLQIQERLTIQVTRSFMDHVQCAGVGLVLECRHMCMESRGIRIHGSTTRTSHLLGIFRDDPATQAEFMSLVNREARP